MTTKPKPFKAGFLAPRSVKSSVKPTPTPIPAAPTPITSISISSPSTKTTTSTTSNLSDSLPSPIESIPETNPALKSRLRAAISSSATTSTTTSTSDNKKEVGISDGFMKEVSTRKLNSFADKKESREVRLNNGIKSAGKVGLTEDLITSTTTTIIPSTPLPTPSPTTTPVQPIPVEQNLITKSLEKSSPIYEPHSNYLSTPTTALGFEFSWNSSPPSRYSLLKSLNPSTLSNLFGSNLSPDLLSEIIQELVKPVTEEEETGVDWKMNLIKGLTKVTRFSSIVGFLDESEKLSLKGLFDQSRKDLISLENSWELL